MRQSSKLRRHIPGFAKAVLAAVILAALGVAALQLSRAEEETPVTPTPSPPTIPVVDITAEQIIIRLKPTVATSEVQAILDLVGAEEKGQIPQLSVIILKVPKIARDAAVEQLKADPRVEYAEPDTLTTNSLTPDDPEYPQQWSWPKTKTDLLWDQHTGGDLPVAVLDTGIDDHPDLAGKILPGGKDFLNDDDDPSDDYGHGTAVASIIASNSNNSLGAAGACWECKVLPVKISGPDGGNDSSMAQGIVFAADQGIKLMNISVNGANTQTRKDAVDYALSKGVLIVSSAGNVAGSQPTFPSGYPDVISVAATMQNDTLRSTSTFGDTVDIAAPGEARVPAFISRIDGYENVTGTSFASPTVAGILANLWSKFPNATPAQLRDIITSTADACCSDKINGGRVNAINAYNALAGTNPNPPNPPPNPPNPPNPKPGDLNGDDNVNLTDLSMLLSKWNTADATADLNDSGKVDLTDLSMLLSAWGT